LRLTNLGSYAFDWCFSLTNVTLANRPTFIGP
jgi:hypothetical protein